MQTYLENILLRIKQFSDTLDKKELFVDKPWVLCDHPDSKVKYIFKRNGELLLAVDGVVSIGKWELIPGANCLFIDRGTDKVLLNNIFVNNSLMVLSTDGAEGKHIIFGNENLIPDLNYEHHLRKVFYEKNKITPVKLTNEAILELHEYEYSLLGLKATINGEVPTSIEVETKKLGRVLKIEQGIVVKVLERITVDTNKGEIVIVQDEKPYIGDKVFKNGFPAPDGIYKIGIFKTIEVKSGQIFRL